jgi:nucleoside phosphorylase
VSSTLLDVTVGVVTALPEEYAAVRVMLNCDTEVVAIGAGAARTYALGRVRNRFNQDHVVAVCLLSEMGNNVAAVYATTLMLHCPNAEHIIMCGIACAVPDTSDAASHVRLGDIVVSSAGGVYQYDVRKELQTTVEVRAPPRPPSAAILEAARRLLSDEQLNIRPWESYITGSSSRLDDSWRRPGEDKDLLHQMVAPSGVSKFFNGILKKLRIADDKPQYMVVPHPRDDSFRRPNQPRVFHGKIASANTLLKNPQVRDSLRQQHRIKAIEMEGAGIADATWVGERGYFIVRGTCDYGDDHKNDEWHKYAALVAAAYTKAVIEAMPVPIYPQYVANPQAASTASADENAIEGAKTIASAATSYSPQHAVFRAHGVEQGVRLGDTALVPRDEAVHMGETASQDTRKEGSDDVVSGALHKEANDRQQQIERMLNSLEYKRALELADEQDAWLLKCESRLPGTLLAAVYEQLARVQLIGSENLGSPSKPDAAVKAKAYLQKARHALRQ